MKPLIILAAILYCLLPPQDQDRAYATLQGMFDRYFTQALPPLPDSVIVDVDQILERCPSPEVKNRCGSLLLQYFITSPIMGMENVAVHIAKKYIDGELHADNEELEQYLHTYVAFNEPSLIGKTAPELSLPDPNGCLVSLKELEADYTILLFYDKDCAVCSEQMPLIRQVYEKYQSRKIAVYAVYTQDNMEAWLRYIADLPAEWIHVWDPDFSSGFHKLYNVTGTPRIFLMDSHKTIIGRELDAHLLDLILSQRP
ncbi:MAG: TlpA family protein disulfide reductase [Bacteroidetes bacterium]|nr:TlpA family protein disulfide reductase [Bacteroidota bacterium]